MNVEQDYFMVLGLRPGASPTEIKTAYRRLAKLYHPDHDRSLDAEVKYKEIRIAYEKLRDCHLTGDMSAGPSAGHEPSVQTKWTSADWETEYDVSNRRIPLEWKNLPSIFISSLKEMPIDVYFRGIFVLAIAFKSLDMPLNPVLPYGKLVTLFYVTSWVFFVFFRYYFSPYEWPFLERFFAGFVYGAILAILINCFYTTSGMNLIWTGIHATASIWTLLIHLDELAHCYR